MSLRFDRAREVRFAEIIQSRAPGVGHPRIWANDTLSICSNGSHSRRGLVLFHHQFAAIVVTWVWKSAGPGLLVEE